MRKLNIIRLIDPRETQIPWVFNAIMEIAPQQLNEPVVEHLRTSPHHNAVGINFHASKPTKVISDSLAQTKSTSEPRFTHEHTFRFARQGISQRFCPCRIGEHTQGNRRTCEISEHRFTIEAIFARRVR